LRDYGRDNVKRNYPLPNGQQVTGEEVDFEVEREGFNSYILADGTKLKLKQVVAQIIRLDAWGPDGKPMYMINGSPVVSADVPDHLKKGNQ
jgi:hypothetical protein